MPRIQEPLTKKKQRKMGAFSAAPALATTEELSTFTKNQLLALEQLWSIFQCQSCHEHKAVICTSECDHKLCNRCIVSSSSSSSCPVCQTKFCRDYSCNDDRPRYMNGCMTSIVNVLAAREEENRKRVREIPASSFDFHSPSSMSENICNAVDMDRPSRKSSNSSSKRLSPARHPIVCQENDKCNRNARALQYLKSNGCSSNIESSVVCPNSSSVNVEGVASDSYENDENCFRDSSNLATNARKEEAHQYDNDTTNINGDIPVLLQRKQSDRVKQSISVTCIDRDSQDSIPLSDGSANETNGDGSVEESTGENCSSQLLSTEFIDGTYDDCKLEEKTNTRTPLKNSMSHSELTSRVNTDGYLQRTSEHSFQSSIRINTSEEKPTLMDICMNLNNRQNDSKYQRTQVRQDKSGSYEGMMDSKCTGNDYVECTLRNQIEDTHFELPRDVEVKSHNSKSPIAQEMRTEDKIFFVETVEGTYMARSQLDFTHYGEGKDERDEQKMMQTTKDDLSDNVLSAASKRQKEGSPLESKSRKLSESVNSHKVSSEIEASDFVEGTYKYRSQSFCEKGSFVENQESTSDTSRYDRGNARVTKSLNDDESESILSNGAASQIVRSKSSPDRPALEGYSSILKPTKDKVGMRGNGMIYESSNSSDSFSDVSDTKLNNERKTFAKIEMEARIDNEYESFLLKSFCPIICFDNLSYESLLLLKSLQEAGNCFVCREIGKVNEAISSTHFIASCKKVPHPSVRSKFYFDAFIFVSFSYVDIE